MKNNKILENKFIKITLSIIVASILVFILYATIELEKKIEKNMFDIATSDILSITNNNAQDIKTILFHSTNYIKDVQNNENIQNIIEKKLKLLLTNNIKYAYLLYKDDNNTFRFLVDASNPSEKAFLNQKFDVDSKDWFDVYTDKKPKIIKHELLKTLSISFLVPILREDSVELLLVIDFSLKKVKHIDNVILVMQNGIIIVLLLIILFLSILFLQMIKYRKVKKSAFIDKLTNVYNRNYLEEYQKKIELEKYILAVIDIDYFKSVNDTYGHDAGDVVLAEVAKIISNTVRVSNDDIVIRFGGEEFVVLIKKSETSDTLSLNVVNRILSNIENYKFKIDTTTYINITASIGVNKTPYISSNFMEAFKLADKALYNAKESGRNNIKIA